MKNLKLAKERRVKGMHCSKLGGFSLPQRSMRRNVTFIRIIACTCVTLNRFFLNQKFAN